LAQPSKNDQINWPNLGQTWHPNQGDVVLVRNVDNLVWLMLVTSGDTFIATSQRVAWRLVWLVDPFPHNGISKLGCLIIKPQLI